MGASDRPHPPDQSQISTRLNYADTHRATVEGCQRGSRTAQFELYRLYSQAMYNTCLRMLRSEADAEDMLQRSFVDVFRHIGQFGFQSSVGAWIKRIVVNNCINHLRKKRLFTEELTDRHQPPTPETDPPESDYSVAGIQEALLQLPDGYRAVFTLYLIEGYDHREIAEILGISEATSKSQFSRAKKKLRELLDRRTGKLLTT